MQYKIEAIELNGTLHNIGVGRDWQHATRQFSHLDTSLLRSAKLVMVTESGRKLDTIIRYTGQRERQSA